MNYNPLCLTDREILVCQHVAEGKKSRRIAYELDISIRTVETHRHNICKKLMAKSIVDLINYANNHLRRDNNE